MNKRMLLILAMIGLGSSPALSHTGAGEVFGFSSSFAHPFLGLDHILATAAVGMWAGHLGGRAALGLPLAFLSAMLLGVTLALKGIDIPPVETGIAGSVLQLGVAVSIGLRLHIALAVMVCGIFGLAHGYAHGTEMGQGAGALWFVAGFVSATALLLTGGLVTTGYCAPHELTLNRLFGGGIAVVGAILLVA